MRKILFIGFLFFLITFVLAVQNTSKYSVVIRTQSGKVVSGLNVDLYNAGTETKAYDLVENDSTAGLYEDSSVVHGQYDLYIGGVKKKSRFWHGANRLTLIADTAHFDSAGHLKTNGMADSIVSLQKFTTAAYDYVGSGGSVTNNPDDVTLETKPGDKIGIKEGGVSEVYLANNAVTMNKIAALSVTNAKIANNTINDAQIADDMISNTSLSANSVQASELADNSVDAGAIQANAVGYSEMADNAIGSDEIIDNTISANDIGEDAITSYHITAGTVTSSDILDGTITSSDISNGTIAKIDIVALTIDSTLLAHSTIDSVRIAPAVIDSAHIDTGAIDSIHLKSGSIYSAHLTNNIINSPGLIQDGAVGSDDIATGGVEVQNLDLNCVTSPKIATMYHRVSQPAGVVWSDGATKTSRAEITYGTDDIAYYELPIPVRLFTSNVTLDSIMVRGHGDHSTAVLNLDVVYFNETSETVAYDGSSLGYDGDQDRYWATNLSIMHASYYPYMIKTQCTIESSNLHIYTIVLFYKSN